MPLDLSEIKYSDLNSKRNENYNYQKISAVLADYGFVTHRLTDDWQWADFIAQHVDGIIFLKVQLKGRLTFDKKYLEKDIYIAFRSSRGIWFLYDHDELFNIIFSEMENIQESKFRKDNGLYSFPGLGSKYRQFLLPYQI
ncbi:hypothetical protein [Rhodohalobacter sp. 8-1]|uniref:hypothetical protein n=1 Tax=Rhodohalobacter sp. 8-1 TaxID=3131972 RepID=UPI0030EEF818